MSKDLNQKEVKIIAGFLASALDIEDDMSKSVYGEFLDKKNWPVNLETDVFETTKKLLTILIKETEEHKKRFLNLMKKINNA